MPRTRQSPENAARESTRVEFKEQLDPKERRDWCEVIKDIVAIANSGGGSVVLGVKNDGSPSSWDPSPILAFDHAKIVDKIAPYTGEQFADFSLREAQRGGKRVAVIEVRGVAAPMVFVQPGTYEIAGGKQEAAFRAGTVYFRHGSKSEPATPHDLKAFVQRQIDQARKELLTNIRRLAYVPAGYELKPVPARLADPSDKGATPIRIVDDPDAPAVRGLDPNKTHPHRQTEVLAKLKEKLRGRRAVNTFDLLCVRRIHKVDESKRAFFYKPMFGSAQYSEAFVDWMVAEYEKSPRFFDRARSAYRRLPQKPQ